MYVFSMPIRVIVYALVLLYLLSVFIHMHIRISPYYTCLPQCLCGSKDLVRRKREFEEEKQKVWALFQQDKQNEYNKIKVGV